MKKIILALAACATILASCQKKEDTDPIDVSKTVYLMDGSWHMKIATMIFDVSDTISAPIDIYVLKSGCVKDNYYVFNTPTRVSEYEGASKCNIGDPDSTVYGYLLSNNDKHLRIWSNPDEENPDTHFTKLEGDITYATIDTFVITYTHPNDQDSTKTSRFTETYVKQK